MHVKCFADKTTEEIETAGKVVGEKHTNLNISAGDQCNMMHALVYQMKESCYYDDAREAYEKVAEAYMTGFNMEAGDSQKKEDFVVSCGW